MSEYSMKKVNKYLFVIDSNDNLVYTTPNHMKHLMIDRYEFEREVVDRLNAGDRYIHVIMDFEEKLWDRHLKKRNPKMYEQEKK